MLTKTPQECWSQFLEFIAERCSATEFENWFASIRVLETQEGDARLEIPNIFVQEYLLDNYKRDLCAFFPVDTQGQPAISFIVAAPEKKSPPSTPTPQPIKEENAHARLNLNPGYTFSHFIEGA